MGMPMARINITQEMIDCVFANSEISVHFKYPEKAKRICQLRLQGNTLREIGDATGVTRERVRQYVNKVSRLYKRWKERNGG